jgi:hypothetical protein
MLKFHGKINRSVRRIGFAVLQADPNGVEPHPAYLMLIRGQ